MTPRSSGRTVRIAHLADIHVRPERGAYEGLLKTFEAVEAISPAVDGILLGGDVVMNTVKAPLDRANELWALWSVARAKHPKLPIFPCIGNQDVWGWHQKGSGCTGKEKLFGKAMALHHLGIPRSYYSTRLRSWRLIVLDSVQRGGSHGFFAGLDQTQRAWLEQELETDQESPTLIASHVPIVPGPAEFFAASAFKPDKHGLWSLEDHLVHIDSFELTELFKRHPNVKLCLAGHTHVAQRVDYAGVAYVVSPPVSGAWWRGPLLGSPGGFNVVDLHPDGRFEIEPVHLELALVPTSGGKDED